MEIHYIYKITNSQTQEFYIGLRTSKCEALFDKYMGSSSVWNREYIKTNKDILVKEILCQVDTRKELKLKEVEILKTFEGNSLCINKLFKIIPCHLGVKQSKEWIEKRKVFGEKNGFFGRHHTEEAKAAMSAKLKGQKRSEEFSKRNSEIHKGKVLTEEIKIKISKSKKEKYANGFKSPSNKPIIVEDLLEGTTTEYESNVTFCNLFDLNVQSVGVFIRKGFTYKKRFKIKYKD